MSDQQLIDFTRIEKAIKFIHKNFKTQPSLNDIANEINLSPYHLQRLFTQWAGISPKKFIQYLSVDYAKKVLKDRKSSLIETSQRVGLSGPSRLHDLFVNIEAMTPGEFKNKGQGLEINYSFSQTTFGNVIVASTQKGICHMALQHDTKTALEDLKKRFSNSKFKHQNNNELHTNALAFFENDWSNLDQIKLHLMGTPFQLKVWECLLKIPMGSIVSYGDIASSIDKPKAVRAVGTAIGANPISYIIPCHRVIRDTGLLGGYRWGLEKKAAILAWEASQFDC